MTGQLNIFDVAISSLDAQIQTLQGKIRSERSNIENLDPKDYEDRNDINACNRMIDSYEQDIKRLEIQKQEYADFKKALNKKTQHHSR